MFDEYHDLDYASLVADMMGEVVRAWPRYDRSKSKPGTHAYRVAWARLRDISRRRTTERRHQQEAHARHEGCLRLSGQEMEVTEGTDAEMAEDLRKLYVMTKHCLEGAGIEIRPKTLSRRYPNKAQRYALLMLQRKHGWSPERTQREMTRRPTVLAAIGLSVAPSYRSLYRAEAAAESIKNRLAKAG